MLADPTRSRAVLIGTHSYKHLEDLPSVANNIKRLRELLIDSGIWGLPQANCSVLIQPDNAQMAATKLEEAAAAATDTLLFYYAGHGLTMPRTLDLGLALVDSRVHTKHTVLPFDWVRDSMLASQAVRKVVILDCCFSARALAGAGMSGSEDLASESEIEGTYLLAAAAETKKALAPPGERYTAFTGELLSILELGIPGAPELLDMTSIYKRMHSELAAKSRPIPQQRNRNTGSQIAFARNKSFMPDNDGTSLRRAVANPEAESHLGLADALQLRARVHSDIGALQEAISLYRQALQIVPLDHVDRTLYLANLGDALRLHVELAGDRRSLTEAVALLRDAVTAAPESNPHRPAVLTSLGNALRLRAQTTGDSGALSEAVQVLQAAVEVSQPGQTDKAESLVSLGTTLWGISAQNDDDSDSLGHALASWDHASQIDAAPVRLRIEAAQRAGHAAISMGDFERGSALLARAVSLMPDLASWNIDLIDRERQLAGLLGLASDAAAAELMLGRPENAIEVLERGRSVIFNRIIELRPDLEALRAIAPELSAEFEELAAEVSAEWLTLGEDRDLQTEWPPPVAEGEASDARHRAAERLEELIARARQLPGMQSFLRPLTGDELRNVGREAPVALVNVSQYRSDALVLTEDGVIVIPLQNLSVEVVNARVAEFLRAVNVDLTGGTFETRIERQQVIRTTLEWLWDALAGPVLQGLAIEGHSFTDPWPRLFWCPTGLLSLLPIHAAGYHHSSSIESPAAVMDMVVSSYTTTLRDLALTSSLKAALGTMDPMLAPVIVALPETPGAPHLPGVASEVEFLRTLFEGASVLSGSAATRMALRHALPNASVLHLACHAFSDVDHPVNSGLALWDGMFTVRDICRDHFTGAQLAVLSACSTTQTAVGLADEAIHIASAFQLAGYRHAVGTMWPINDRVAVRFTKLLYSAIYTEKADPAYALHAATSVLRHTYITQPELWAPLVHFGPSRATQNEASVIAFPPDEDQDREMDAKDSALMAIKPWLSGTEPPLRRANPIEHVAVG